MGRCQILVIANFYEFIFKTCFTIIYQSVNINYANENTSITDFIDFLVYFLGYKNNYFGLISEYLTFIKFVKNLTEH